MIKLTSLLESFFDNDIPADHRKSSDKEYFDALKTGDTELLAKLIQDAAQMVMLQITNWKTSSCYAGIVIV